MYESHFGLTTPPFQLSADPAFYFDSRGHHTALAYMRYGLHGGEGFIVITGEVGAGKTTLVRALLAEIDPSRIVAAHVVSTQLAADDLLPTILMSFGVRRTGTTKAQMLGTLEAFLLQVAAQGRRALLIVDEAQNLSAQALEELRMLSNFQLETQSLLQSFLIGQPELQRTVRSAPLEQLRQRITASCHLGPLDMAETRPYVEHRLRTAGWKQRPEFEPAVFERLHELTHGIPRAVNRLCHRLLLAAYLGNKERIDVALVDEAGHELEKEVGLTPRPPDAKAATDVRTSAAAPAGDAGTRSSAAAAPPVSMPRQPVWAPAMPVMVAPALTEVQPLDLWADGGEAGLGGYALFLATSTAERLKAGALAQAFAASANMPPVLVAYVGEGFADLELSGRLVGLPLPAQTLALGADAHGHGGGFAPLVQRVAQVLRGRRPGAVAVFGASDLATAGLLLARKLGIPALRLVGPQRGTLTGDTPMNLALAEVLAEHCLLETGLQQADAPGNLPSAGLMADVLAPLQQRWPADIDLLGALRLPDDLLKNRGGYLLASHLDADQPNPAIALERWIEPLSALGRRAPVLWAAPPAQAAALRASGWLRRLADTQVHVLPDVGYVQGLRLLRDAAALISQGTREWAEEADAFGVPRLDHLALNKALLLEPRARGSIETLVDPRERVARPQVPVRASGASGRVAQHFERWWQRAAVAPARG
jgi:general secretion pathway protein A